MRAVPVTPRWRVNRNVYWSSCKVPTRYSCPNLVQLSISRQIFQKYSYTKFHHYPFCGSRVVPCGRRYRQTDVTKLSAILRMRLTKDVDNSVFLGKKATFFALSNKKTLKFDYRIHKPCDNNWEKFGNISKSYNSMTFFLFLITSKTVTT